MKNNRSPGDDGIVIEAIKEKKLARTKVKDAVLRIVELKWNWAGHVARLKDERWTRRMIEWRPRQDAFRSRGRPPTRWADDVKRVAGNWIQIAQDRNKWKGLREAYVQQWTT
ncbi:hypothetical protein RN001_016385 [Aquatica leii]|uniref:Endonuclease-reverse transcriptase n=1 Tax=Aquatica leii TaxID=1421715 RepID=A0AAN7NZB4_9COLE|nr:hypothetical protein RN001_016385 [Aquatica leii]